jgi:hypothetical protein
VATSVGSRSASGEASRGDERCRNYLTLICPGETLELMTTVSRLCLTWVGAALAGVGGSVATECLQDPLRSLALVDSKGRTRVKAEEDGDAYRLGFLDRDGKPRIVLSTSSSGLPTIALGNADGSTAIMMGQEPGGGWRLVVRSSGMAANLVATVDGEVGLVCAGTQAADSVGDEPSLVLTSSKKLDATRLVLKSPSDLGGVSTEAWNAKGASRGLALVQEKKGVVGLGHADETGCIWIGESPFDGNPLSDGVRLLHKSGVSAKSEMRLRGGRSAEAQVTKDGGCGLRFSDGLGIMQMGLSHELRPRIVMQDGAHQRREIEIK